VSLKEEGTLAVIICALYDVPSEITQEIHIIRIIVIIIIIKNEFD